LLGAKIGTTITGVLVGLKEILGVVSYIFMALAAVGVFITMFTKKDKIKQFATILIGVGLIFIALEIMGDAVQKDIIKDAMATMFSAVDFPLLLVLFGVIATAILQSSSVVTGIIIMLVSSGAVTAELALFLVLGANIGTTISAIFASIGASTNAKRAAFIMVFVSTVGVILLLPFVWIFPSEIVAGLNVISGGHLHMAVAFFHLFYNVISSMIQIFFVKPIVRLAERVIPDKKEKRGVRQAVFPRQAYFADAADRRCADDEGSPQYGAPCRAQL
jgi:phosphate:Na+ symporter